jgi:electron transport complex protein RnfB
LPASPANDKELVQRIDDVLPQTQCRRCGYAGCRPYAEALAAGETTPDRCPPGGGEVLVSLAGILGRSVTPLHPDLEPVQPSVAIIDEARCIGCTLCIQACPVDAIVGAAKLMHTVIAAECSGCALCLPPCPVDCITLDPVSRSVETARQLGRHWRSRYEARNRRLERDKEERRSARERAAQDVSAEKRERIAAAVAAAMERARQRREAAGKGNHR